MSHILNALLSSTRISHDIAMRTLGCLIDENYHDLAVLHQSTWEQRTEVLTKGGYVRYREKTATFLGDLAILVENKYNDDAANILPRDEAGEGARTTLSARLKEIKGLGPMGTEIFLGSIQHFFENVAPFLDSRSKKTAIAIRFGEDVDTIFAALQKNTASMAKLEVALTRIRLEKREGEFTRDIVNS
ncbi:hypothetical protein NKR23_g11913 [Pleurostoma richardsiae]|uniref:Uncharacterized protein n=1 Tax=Pleurostoma richardsiae TaxID=41990 RepID=A0AA38R6X2_9PEZI|nr:hypothetical protein NKR23_g11913 [Pleurostoma richardsiae]